MRACVWGGEGAREERERSESQQRGNERRMKKRKNEFFFPSGDAFFLVVLVFVCSQLFRVFKIPFLNRKRKRERETGQGRESERNGGTESGVVVAGKEEKKKTRGLLVFTLFCFRCPFYLSRAERFALSLCSSPFYLFSGDVATTCDVASGRDGAQVDER